MQYFHGFLIGHQEMRQPINDQQLGLAMRVSTTERVRVRDKHSIDIMDVGKCRDTCLIRQKEYQQG